MSATLPLVEEESDLRRPITVDEFLRMVDAEIIDAAERVELIEGGLYRMSPSRRPHGIAQARVITLLSNAFAENGYEVSLTSIRLDDSNFFDPDVLVERADPSAGKYAGPARVVLAVEVSDSTLGKDQKVKLAVYARAGIPEYWIVNLRAGSLEVYRDPQRDKEVYATVLILKPGETLAALFEPAVPIAVADIFRPNH